MSLLTVVDCCQDGQVSPSGMERSTRGYHLQAAEPEPHTHRLTATIAGIKQTRST